MPQVVVEQNYGEAKRAIVKGLVAFNRAAVGKHAWKQIAVTARDEGRIVGGALGALWIEWLFIELLWLGEAFRGRDIGTELMGKLEDEARRRGAKHAYVDTFSFQAPGFYEKLGFREFGRLDPYFETHARIWLTKPL
jgi:ribosomal protein S18 acetylase RimI-like enzyme